MKSNILKYPVKNPQIIQEFGHDNTNDPIRKNFYSIFDNKHPGIDFKLPTNSKVYAALNGIVVRNEYHKGMGNVIATRNGNIVILYAHLNKIDVKLGDKVKTGDMLGLSGNTGLAITNSPHLHFEIRDITKSSLKKMVLKPIFNKPVRQLKKNFKYKINNINTLKTLEFLALRYFGTKNYWDKILKANPNLNISPKKTIKTNTIVTIPNYL